MRHEIHTLSAVAGSARAENVVRVTTMLFSSCPSGKALKTWAPRLPLPRGRGGSPPLPLPPRPGSSRRARSVQPLRRAGCQRSRRWLGLHQTVGGWSAAPPARGVQRRQQQERRALSRRSGEGDKDRLHDRDFPSFPRFPEISRDLTVKVFSDHSQAVSKVLTEIDCQNFQTKVLARGPHTHIDY